MIESLILGIHTINSWTQENQFTENKIAIVSESKSLPYYKKLLNYSFFWQNNCKNPKNEKNLLGKRPNNYELSQSKVVINFDSTDWQTADLSLQKNQFSFNQLLPTTEFNINIPNITVNEHTNLIAQVPIYRQKPTANVSYDTPPFASEVWKLSWGSGQGLAPQLWFWENVPQYNELKRQINAAAAKLQAENKVPFAGLQLWQDVFKKSQSGGQYSNLAGHQAWVQWIKTRPEYLGVDYSGVEFGWGYVSPLVPLKKEDYPSNFQGSTAYYADWQADRFGRLAAFTGVQGFLFSDFFDSHPHTGIQNYFNARIIDDFKRVTSTTLSSQNITAQAEEIRSRYYMKWLDYWVDRWAYSWAAIDREIRKHTGKPSWLINQTSFTPAGQRRFGAVDPRIILQKMSPDNVVFQVQTVQGFMMRQLPIPESYESASIGIHAAREPEAHYGHILMSSEDRYWAAVNKLWPELTQQAREEVGNKRLKRTWLESGWTHIATRQGNVRRATESWSRSYHDIGKVDENWVRLLRGIDPTRPFGPAIYYSVGVERGYESYYGAKGNILENSYLGTQLKPVTEFKNIGVPFNYYVSDAALSKLSSRIAPSAWIIPDRYLNGQDLLPQKEREVLQKFAPILTQDQIQNYKYPLTFSTNNSTRKIEGFGFYDQNDRLIVVASDRITIGETNNTIGAVQVTVNLKLPDGSYTARNLLNNQTISFKVVSGSGKFITNVDRWDTQAFEIVRT